MKFKTSSSATVMSVVPSILVAVSLLLAACDVGIGGKVDVNSPNLTLDNLKPGDYLKGVVTLEGTAKDDIGVTGVQISTDGGTTFTSLPKGNLSGAGTSIVDWTFTLDTRQLADGPLRVVIRATDDSGRVTSTEELLFKVDNNPPVVLVSTQPQFEGLVLNTSTVITVNAKDVNPIDGYRVEVWASEPESSTKDRADLEASDWVAASVLNTESSQKSSPWNYTFTSKAFTKDLDLDKRFFKFAIYVIDEAGNESETFFHRDEFGDLDSESVTLDLIASVISDGATVENTSGVTLGKSDFEARAWAASSSSPFVLLFDEEYDIPKAGITNPLSASDTPTMRSNDIVRGYFEDDDGVDVASLKYSLYRLVNDEPVLEDGHELASILTYKIHPTEGNKRIDWELDLDVGQGKFRIDLFANDVSAAQVPSKPFKYEFFIADGNPTINIDNPPTIYFADRIVLEGSASFSLPIEQVLVDIGYGSTSNPTIVFSGMEAEYDTVELSWTFDTTGTDISTLPEGNIIIVATAATGSATGTSKLTLIRDSGSPTANWASPEENSELNQVAILEGSTGDTRSGVDKLEFSVAAGAGSPAGTWWEYNRDAGAPALADDGYEFEGTIANFKFKFDTEEFDDGVITVWARATDRAGNQTVTSRLFEIRQDSDLPKLTFTNIDPAGQVTDNVLSGSPAARVSGNAIDDDGFINGGGTLSYRVREQSGAWSSWLNVTGSHSSGRVDFNFELRDPDSGSNPKAALPDGIYDIQVWVQDANGLGPARGNRDTQATIIPFAIDNGPPSLAFTGTTPTAGSHVNTDFQVGIATSDALGLKLVTVELNGSVTSLEPIVVYDAATDIDPNKKVWNGNVPVSIADLDSGTYNIVVTSTDNANTPATVNRTIIIDKELPTLEISTPAADAIVNGVVSFRGTSNDNQQVVEVRYWIEGEGQPEAAPGDKSTWLSGVTNTYSWRLDWDSTAVVDGSYTAYFAAKDQGGNWSTAAILDFEILQASDMPTISLTGLDVSANTEETAYLNLIESNAVLRFVVEDDDMVNTSSILISVDGGAFVAVNRNGAGAYSNAVSINASHNLSLPSTISEGTHSFELKVTDLASAKNGKPAVTYTLPPVYFMVDRNFPVVTETSLGSGQIFKSAAFQLSGSVSDTNQLKKLEVFESVDGGADEQIHSELLDGTSDTWVVANLPSGGASDGTYVYTIRVSDASDKQTILSRTVIIDTTSPADPVVSDPAASGWIKNTTHNFRGSATDGTGSGIAKVFVHQSALGGGVPAKGAGSWTEASFNSGTGEWVAALSIPSNGELELHVYALDVAGNTSNIVTHLFGLDPTAPVVSVSGGIATLYVNDDFSIGGTFTDISGIASVLVEVSTDNISFDEASPATASVAYSPNSWAWEADTDGMDDGNYYYRFTFTDLAGNVAQAQKSVNLDRSAPVVTFTGSTPSIDFNGTTRTATANGLMSLSGTVTEDQGISNLQSLSYTIDDGEAVSLPINGTFTIASIDTSDWYPTGELTLTISAEDKNGNTGTRTFTFNVDEGSDLPVLQIVSPVDGATVNSITIPVNGSIVDDDGIPAASGALQYRYSDTGLVGDFGGWTNVTPAGGTLTSRTFNFNIASGSDGAKLVDVRAYDTNGLVSETVRLSLSVDTGAPAFSDLLPADGSSRNANFSVTGNVKDNTSVTLLRYRVERDGVQTLGWTNLAGTPSAPDTPIAFTAPVSTAAGSGQYEVFLEASDGTFTRTTSLRYTVDKVAPSLSFTSPAAGETTNNVLTISGTASDNYGVSSLQFRIVDANAGGVERVLPTGSATGTTNWSITGFDTRNATLLSYAQNQGTGVYQLTLRATVADAAGNVYTTAGGNDLVFLINQVSDRPVITFADIDTDGTTILSSNVISGNVTDDDGVASIIVETWDAGNNTATPSRTETVELTRGGWGGKDLDWRVTLASSGNGQRAVRVRVVDIVDNNGADYSPADTSRADSTKIIFGLDTEVPDAAFTSPAANVTWSGSDSFTLSGTAADETGISSLTYKIDDNDFSSGGIAISGPWDNWSFTVPQGNLSNGAHTIYVQAEDAIGRTRVISRPLSVDKTGPTLAILNPLSGSAVFGPLTITGTSTDNVGGAGVASVSIGLGHQIDPDDLEGSTWVAVGGTTSWTYTFTNINDFANAIYATNVGDTNANGLEDNGEIWSDLWDFKFWVRAQDSAGVSGPGNISYLSNYVLQIDPKRDRPEATVMSPENGATVGGFLRVFGTAFDSQFVEKVQIAIDANADGDYTNDPVWEEGDLDEVDGGVRWYLVSGTTSWNIRLNENQEFDPVGAETTRTIRFKVRAKDYKVTPGDGVYGGEIEREITFNKNFPQFSAMSLNSGDTVGGTVYLTGLIRDESDIERIVFSNESPQINNRTIFVNPGNLNPAASGNTNVSSAAATEVGVTVFRLGTADPDYNANYPGSYRVSIPINTGAAGLYPNGAGTMSVKLTAEDNTSPSPFTNQYLITLSVDNVAPSSLAYSGATNILGSAAELKGSVRDLGTVSGIDGIFVYLTNLDGELVRLQGGTGSVGGFDPGVLLDKNVSTYADYRMFIDNRYESGADSGPNGDNDGISEFLTLSAGTYYWSGLFDSTALDDGAVTINMVARDFAGNTATTTSQAFIANNGPRITSIQLATDLNRNAAVDAGEYAAPITAGFSATGFKARNNLLGIKVNTSGGNSTLRYSVVHNGVELNSVLTNGTIVIDTSGFAESLSPNDTSFTIRVYDSTTSDDADDTNELFDEITVNLTIDNVDSVAPTISVSPFGKIWSQAASDGSKVLGAIASYDMGIAKSGGKLLGHIEYAENSTHDNAGTTDADVSGRVLFRGKVWDDQQIQRIRAQIPNFNGGAGVGNAFDVYTAAGGALSGANWAFSIEGDAVLDEALGNHFNWVLEVNTAAISTIAANNVVVTLSVQDYGVSAAQTSALQVDVVPYIASIERNPDIYATFRSKWGTYPVQSGETGIIVNGFNLPATSNGSNWLRVYNTAGTQNQPATSSSVNADRTQIIMSLAGVTRSGYLRVSTNGITDINKINDNLLAWNREDDGSGIANTLWTDDRYLSIWGVGDYFANSGTPEHPSMDIRQSNGNIYGMWSNYAASAAYYARPVSQSATRTLVHSTYDPPEWTDIAVETGSNEIHSVILENYYQGTNTSTWGYLASYVNTGSRVSIERLGNQSVDGGTSHADGADELLFQFQNARIVIANEGTNQRYVAYYDSYGRVVKYARITGSTATYAAINNMTNGNNVVDGIDDFDDDPSDSGPDVGQYLDIQMDPDDNVPVIVYYDTTNKTLKIARARSAQPVGTAGWNITNVLPVNSFAGQYVSMKIDKNPASSTYGDLFISFYKVSTGDLVFIHAADVDGLTAGTQYTFDAPVVIDDEGAVGAWTDITLIDGKPVISYLNSTQIGTYSGLKMARYIGDGSSWTNPDDWEHEVIPADSEVFNQRTNVVGLDAANQGSNVWKYAVGYASAMFDIVYWHREQ